MQIPTLKEQGYEVYVAANFEKEVLLFRKYRGF